MTIFEQLTSNIILHPNQGYAFYYYNNKEEIGILKIKQLTPWLLLNQKTKRFS